MYVSKTFLESNKSTDDSFFSYTIREKYFRENRQEWLFTRLTNDLETFDGVSIYTLMSLPKVTMSYYIKMMISVGLITAESLIGESTEEKFQSAIEQPYINRKLQAIAHDIFSRKLKWLDGLPLDQQADLYEEKANEIYISLAVFNVTNVFEVKTELKKYATRYKPSINQFSSLKDLLLYKLHRLNAQYQNTGKPEEFESVGQEIAWMDSNHAFDYIKEKCKVGDTINFRKLAKLVCSFKPEFELDTVRKILDAMYNEYTPKSNLKNNPLKSEKNRTYIAYLKEKYKI